MSKANRVAREKIVPRFEPEVQTAMLRAYRGNDGAPSTGLSTIIQFGVEITSRWKQADEFEVMTKVLKILPREVFNRIRMIFCDSETGRSYSVELRPSAQDKASDMGQILKSLDQAFLIALSGYTRLSVFCNGEQVEILNKWPAHIEADLPDPPIGIDEFEWEFNSEPTCDPFDD